MNPEILKININKSGGIETTPPHPKDLETLKILGTSLSQVYFKNPIQDLVKKIEMLDILDGDDGSSEDTLPGVADRIDAIMHGHSEEYVAVNKEKLKILIKFFIKNFKRIYYGNGTGSPIIGLIDRTIRVLINNGMEKECKEIIFKFNEVDSIEKVLIRLIAMIESCKDKKLREAAGEAFDFIVISFNYNLKYNTFSNDFVYFWINYGAVFTSKLKCGSGVVYRLKKEGLFR